MNPAELGNKYDKIATWWQSYHRDSGYGVKYLHKAMEFVLDADSSSKQSGGTSSEPSAETNNTVKPDTMTALDVGCGAGGRFIRVLEQKGFAVTGVDVSQTMIELAVSQHTSIDNRTAHQFIHADICTWQSQQGFDLVYAWDSLFHLPLEQQARVLNKLAKCLNQS